MKGAWFKRRSPIALDIGASRIKAVQLGWRGGQWCLEAASCVPRIEPGAPLKAEEVSRLVEVLARQGFQGRQAVVAAGDGMLLHEVLDLPPASSGAPLSELARVEMARINNRPPQSFEMVCWELPPSTRTREQSCVLATACPHEQAETILDALEAGGLRVLAIEAAALSQFRACRPLLGRTESIQGLLDLGWSGFRLVAVTQGVVCYERTLPETGLADLMQTISQKFNVPLAEMDMFLSALGVVAGQNRHGALPPDPATAEQVRSLIQTHFRTCRDDIRATFEYVASMYPGAAVQGLLLMGGGASLLDPENPFGKELDLETHVVRPCELVPVANWTPWADLPSLATAIGLAQFREDAA